MSEKIKIIDGKIVSAETEKVKELGGGANKKYW